MSTEIAPLPGNLPASPLPFSVDTGQGSDSGMNPLVRMLSAFRRFAWLIILMTIVGATAGWLATRYMPPKYVVQGTVFLEARATNTGPVEADPFLQGTQWLELIKNPQVLDNVVEQQRLYLVGPNPGPSTPTREGPTGPNASLFDDFGITDRFVPGRYEISFASDGQSWELKNPTRPDLDEKGLVGDSAGTRAGMSWVPRPRKRMFGKEFAFTLRTPREVSNDIADALSTRMQNPRGGRFVSVSYDATDPVRAARTLNAILDRFVRRAAALKSASLVQTSAALDSQLLSAETRMKSADLALQNFKINTVTAPREESVPIAGGLQMTSNYTYSSYMQLRTVVDSLRREQSQLTQLLGAAKTGGLVADQLTAIGIVRTSPQLMAAIGQLGKEEAALRDLQGPEGMLDLNNRVIKQKAAIDLIRDTTLQQLGQAVVSRVGNQIQDLDQRIASTAREMRDIPQRSLTEARLTNDLDLARNTYTTVRNRAELARLQEASSLPDVKVLNQAVPPLAPTKNRRMVILVLGTLAGLAVGFGLAFLLDLLDKRFRYADQVTKGLGLSILGVVPEIRRAKGKGASAEEAAQVVEAFRTIRLNLSHVFPDTDSIAMTISSPMPGDGKSLVSSNLALSFAEAGYRTLLIDGDTRRGELHRTFGTDRRPGMLDHLAGDLPWIDALRETSHPKLTLMPAGSRHRNAPELMGSRKMHELMAELRNRHEVIIVDSPPLAAGIDPFVLGTVCGNLVMVVRAGSTERDLAEAKLQIIDRLPIRLVGAVLNDVSSSMDEYKYYAYNYSYGTTEEDEELVQLPAPIT